jgi:hypothetical protein
MSDTDSQISAGADRDKSPLAVSHDADRAEMIARHARMTVEERVELFERLSREAAWVRSSAKRIR